MATLPVGRRRRNGYMRGFGVLAVCVVAASGCGNRKPSAASASDSSKVESTATTDAVTTGAMFGTLKSPCGSGDAKGATDVGVTDTTIKIGVITDTDAGPIRVPTAGIEPSMKAFTKYCNDLGGINGRKLELKSYDSKLFKSLDAIKDACDDHLFALVGSGSVLDAPIAQPMIDCDLVSVPAYSATYPLGVSPNVVSPIPNPGNMFPTGPSKYIAKTYPQAIKKAAIFYPMIGASKDQGERTVEAGKKAGFKYVYTGTYKVIETDWKTQVQTLVNKGVEYVTIIDTANAAISMLQAMSDANFHPQVIDLGQQFYDPTIAQSGFAEGALVLTNTQPFEEPNAAISSYVKLLKQADSTAIPTTLGVQGFSAGLLFATAAKSLGSKLTRTSLLSTLNSVHEWDGGGLHPTQDPGRNVPNTCTLYLEVKDKKFTRKFPAAPSKGFSCDPDNLMKLTGSWGTAPHKKQ